MPRHLPVLILAALLAACTQPMQKSEGHISEQAVTPPGNIPPPVQALPVLPKPKPMVRQETYSVVVNNIRVQELLFALARDAKINVDIHPGIDRAGHAERDRPDAAATAFAHRQAGGHALRARRSEPHGHAGLAVPAGLQDRLREHEARDRRNRRRLGPDRASADLRRRGRQRRQQFGHGAEHVYRTGHEHVEQQLLGHPGRQREGHPSRDRQDHPHRQLGGRCRRAGCKCRPGSARRTRRSPGSGRAGRRRHRQHLLPRGRFGHCEPRGRRAHHPRHVASARAPPGVPRPGAGQRAPPGAHRGDHRRSAAFQRLSAGHRLEPDVEHQRGGPAGAVRLGFADRQSGGHPDAVAVHDESLVGELELLQHRSSCSRPSATCACCRARASPR